MPKPKSALITAIDRAGGQTELALKLTVLLKQHPYPQMRKRRVTQPIVAQWVSRGRAAADMCPLIEHTTGISCHSLRPDTFIDTQMLKQKEQAPLGETHNG